MQKIRIVSVAAALLIAFSGFAGVAYAAPLTDVQIQAILSLLNSFGADQATINAADAAMHGQAPAASSTTSAAQASTTQQTGTVPQAGCEFVSELTGDLSIGSSGPEVSALQEFLKAQGDFTYPEITDYFGLVTEGAVQAWQSAHDIVSSGSPETTGYGVVGTATRAAMRAACGLQDETSGAAANTTPGIGYYMPPTAYLGSVSSGSYALNQVQSVTKIPFDATSGTSAGDTYTIVLTDGTVHTVTSYAGMTANDLATALAATGYTGDAAALLSRAQ